MNQLGKMEAMHWLTTTETFNYVCLHIVNNFYATSMKPTVEFLSTFYKLW